MNVAELMTRVVSSSSCVCWQFADQLQDCHLVYRKVHIHECAWAQFQWEWNLVPQKIKGTNRRTAPFFKNWGGQFRGHPLVFSRSWVMALTRFSVQMPTKSVVKRFDLSSVGSSCDKVLGTV